MNWKAFYIITVLLFCVYSGVVYLVDGESHQEPINSTPVATHSELEVVSPIMEVQCLRPNGEVKAYLVKDYTANVRYGNSKSLSSSLTNVTITTMVGVTYTVAINRCEFRWL